MHKDKNITYANKDLKYWSIKKKFQMFVEIGHFKIECAYVLNQGYSITGVLNTLI